MVFKQSNEQSFTKDYNVDTEKNINVPVNV